MHSSFCERVSSLLIIALFLASTTGTAAAQSFGSGYVDGRKYYLYTPSSYSPGTPMPLVVALHGCTQFPTQFAVDTQLNAYAEQYGFLVAYPNQPAYANPSKCWNWFYGWNQTRGGYESGDIAEIVQRVRSIRSVDSGRIYATGFSAGAAMSSVMGAAYPDLFAAIAVNAGVEYAAASTSSGGLFVQANGGPDPDGRGVAAYQEMGSRAQRVRVLVVHGTSDPVVVPVNGDQVIQQWAQTNDLVSDGVDNDDVDAVADAAFTQTVPGGRTYDTFVYRDSQGQEWGRKVRVRGMTHRYAGGPGNAEYIGGSIYTDPAGPSSTELTLAFFGLLQKRESDAPATLVEADVQEQTVGAISPHPVQQRGTLSLTLPEATDVRADVYDLMGRRVSTLADRTFPAGRHSLTVDASRWAAGTYLLRLHLGDTVETQRVTVVR